VRRGGRALGAVAVVAVCSLACGRKAGPKAGETTLWRIDAPGASATGCDEAGPLVDLVTEAYAPGLGIGWRVGASGETAQLLTCDEFADAISIDDCLPDGVVGQVAGDAIEWVDEVVFFEAADCTLTSITALTVTDDGLEGTLRATVTFEEAGGPRCAYELDGEPISPDGCAVAIEADLVLVEVSEK
jgi:hypothetical protein